MTRKLLHIFLVAATMLTALSLGSCSLIYDHYELDDTEVTARPMSVLKFSLTLPQLHESRAPQGDYNPGTEEWENYVECINDMRIYFFGMTDNKMLGALDPTDVLVSPVALPDANPQPSKFKKYDVTGTLRLDLPSQFKIVVLANCRRDYPAAESIASIDDLTQRLTYSVNHPLTKLDATHLIPMYGVQEVTGANFAPGEVTSVGTIYLLRAMAKVDVCVDAEETHDLEYVELINYNKTGYCAPHKVYRRADYVKGDYEHDYVARVSILGDANEDNSSEPWALGCHSMVEYPEGVSRKIFTIYVPEYRNLIADAQGMPTTTLGDNHAYMRLKFADELDNRIYELDFKHYSKPDQPYFDIQRNNYYRYTVKRTDRMLSVIAEVHPYRVADLNPDFGIETGKPIWEGVWSTDSTPLTMTDLSSLHFDWSTVSAGQQLMLHMISRAPATNPNLFWVRLMGYDGGLISGTSNYYYNPTNGNLTVKLTQAMLNDIRSKNGLAIETAYCILYRITLK